MANSNRKEIVITDTTFDGIRSSLNDFLSQQDTFSSYNFRGTALSTIVDLLSANTYWTMFYANMLANEMFLDSAQLITSAAKIAKHLGYVPDSITSSSATVDLSFTGTLSSNSVDVLSGSVSRSNAGTTYTFWNVTKFYISDGEATNVELKEGTLTTFDWIYNTDRNVRYVIPHEDVDISTLVIDVYTSTSSSTPTRYTLADDILEIDSDSEVFWIQGNGDTYEIFFGDGTVGKSLENGYKISAKYLISSGKSADGLSLDGYSFISGSDTATISATARTSGGAVREPVDHTRFFAPISYEAQNRCVTVNDYSIIINQECPFIESVSVWGGEDNNPPRCGYVLVSAKSEAGESLTEYEKSKLLDVMSNKGIVGTVPEYIEPDNTYLQVYTDILYNEKAYGSENVITDAKSAMLAYGDDVLEKFDQPFLYSYFVALIDDSNSAIVGNNTKIRLRKPTTITGTDKSYSYSINFSVELDPYSLISENFYSTLNGAEVVSYISDDGSGNVILNKRADNGVYDKFTIGSINYTTGVVTMSMQASSSSPTSINIYAYPLNQGAVDITPANNQILFILEDDIINISITKAT
jgi:hypothetical protein